MNYPAFSRSFGSKQQALVPANQARAYVKRRDSTVVDTAALLARIDLEQLISQDVELYRVGRELHGACPLCTCSSGARRHRCDRFRLDAERTRWYCRQCAPNGGDAITYMQRRDELSFRAACQALGASSAQIPKTAGKCGIISRPEADEDESPPSAVWQARAADYIATAEAALWEPAGAAALAYLHDKRGLSDETIKRWRLGYHAAERYEPAREWGLEGKDLWLPSGIVIPWLHNGEPWAIKIRRRVPARDPHKYHLVRESKCHVLFGAETVVSHRPAILMEAELDVLLLDQQAGDITASVSVAGTRGDFTRRQLIVLRKSHPIYVALDNDEAGHKATQTIVAYGPRFRPVTWPDGVKDLTDAWQVGHDVRAWASAQLGEPWDAAAADRLWADAWAKLEDLPPGCLLNDPEINQAEDAFNESYLARDLTGVRAAIEQFAVACRRQFAAEQEVGA